MGCVNKSRILEIKVDFTNFLLHEIFQDYYDRNLQIELDSLSKYIVVLSTLTRSVGHLSRYVSAYYLIYVCVHCDIVFTYIYMYV